MISRGCISCRERAVLLISPSNLGSGRVHELYLLNVWWRGQECGDGFPNRMPNTVIDRFGKDVLAYSVDKDHFRITVPVAVSDQFFRWIFSLGSHVTIVGPEDVKDRMKLSLAKIAKRYEK